MLGCSGTHSSATNGCSSYLVQTAGANVLLDAGPGCSIELQRHLALDELDAIVLSHEHPDHWTEMPTLYHAFCFTLTKRIAVYGTKGTRDRLLGASPEACDDAFDWTVIDEDSELEIADQSWTFSLTDHPVETLASRVESGGVSLAYSADTGPDWSPERFGQPIDLMVYEASLTVDLEPNGIPHVSGREAAIRATAAGVQQLVLTHVPPGHDPNIRRQDAEKEFLGSIELAEPGRTFVVEERV